MRYQKQIDKIRLGQYSRSDLLQLRENVQLKVSGGDTEARAVLDEIDRAASVDSYMVFMGFCPSADIKNRLDIEWKKQGTCTFVFHESDQQSERFNAILPGLPRAESRSFDSGSLKSHSPGTGFKAQTAS